MRRTLTQDGSTRMRRAIMTIMITMMKNKVTIQENMVSFISLCRLLDFICYRWRVVYCCRHCRRRWIRYASSMSCCPRMPMIHWGWLISARLYVIPVVLRSCFLSKTHHCLRTNLVRDRDKVHDEKRLLAYGIQEVLFEPRSQITTIRAKTLKLGTESKSEIK